MIEKSKLRLWTIAALLVMLGVVAGAYFLSGQPTEILPARETPAASAGRDAGSANEAQRYYGRRANWSEPNRGSINHSIYVFRDSNRNGVYDIGDRPMASIAVEMTGPDGGAAVRRSNVQGFTNFAMSASEANAAIRRPGSYSFRAIVPPGWSVTSGNVRQTLEFEALTGAIGDLIARTLPRPIGFAPDLTIAGRVAMRDADGALQSAPGATVLAIAPDGTRRTVTLGADGSFEIPAVQGAWRIVARHLEASVERRVEVGQTPVRLSALVPGDSVPTAAARTVRVDFEEISPSTLAKVPSGTAGIDWQYLNATEMLLYDGEGYVNAVMSGHYVAYNSSGHPVTLSRAGGFDFVGAYLGLAWRNAEGEELIVQAWRGERLVAEEVIALSSLGPVWFAADYRNITRLTLTTRHYWQFVIDDIVLRVPAGD